MSDDLYSVLGVSTDATSEAIKVAYRKLSKENHPDKGGDPEVFGKLAEAYRVLSNEDLRAKYDAGEPVISEDNQVFQDTGKRIELMMMAFDRAVEQKCQPADWVRFIAYFVSEVSTQPKRDLREVNGHLSALKVLSESLEWDTVPENTRPFLEEEFGQKLKQLVSRRKKIENILSIIRTTEALLTEIRFSSVDELKKLAQGEEKDGNF